MFKLFVKIDHNKHYVRLDLRLLLDICKTDICLSWSIVGIFSIQMSFWVIIITHSSMNRRPIKTKKAQLITSAVDSLFKTYD